MTARDQKLLRLLCVLLGLLSALNFIQGLSILWDPINIVTSIGIEVPTVCQSNVQLFNSWVGFSRVNYALILAGITGLICRGRRFCASTLAHAQLSLGAAGFVSGTSTIDAVALGIGSSLYPKSYLLINLLILLFVTFGLDLLIFVLWREVRQATLRAARAPPLLGSRSVV